MEERKTFFPSTLLGSPAGTLEIKLTKEKLTREKKQHLLICAVRTHVGETNEHLKGWLEHGAYVAPYRRAVNL